MKKIIIFLTLVLSLQTFGIEPKLKDVKKVDKEVKNVASEDKMLEGLNTKLKNLQNEKGPILFKPGKAELDVEKCKKTLEALAEIINSYKMFRVQIEGHTDNVGNKKVNLVLSQKRAEAVVNWLIKYGKVSPKQLSAKGFGDEKPIADNNTEEGRAKNRRVDFSVTKLY